VRHTEYYRCLAGLSLHELAVVKVANDDPHLSVCLEHAFGHLLISHENTDGILRRGLGKLVQYLASDITGRASPGTCLVTAQARNKRSEKPTGKLNPSSISRLETLQRARVNVKGSEHIKDTRPVVRIEKDLQVILQKSARVVIKFQPSDVCTLFVINVQCGGAEAARGNLPILGAGVEGKVRDGGRRNAENDHCASSEHHLQ
jgi:hypothetical protein